LPLVTASLILGRLDTGRRFVGVELDPAMFAEACQRIAKV
jgi:hypothetical protein